MTESQLKNYIGIFIMLSHFFIILLLIFLGIRRVGGFSFEEMTTAIALISPMFSLYTTAIIKYVMSNKVYKKLKEKRLSKIYIFISFFLPILFIASLILIIILKAFNIAFSEFEEFKIMLGVNQTAFGAYTALVLSSLFEIQQNKNSDKFQTTRDE